MRSVETVVIGGGLAGLAAAVRLQRAGREVLVLEARSRVGGRVHSVLVPAQGMVDVGAQWIGPGQERMAALARASGARTVPTFKEGLNQFELGGRAFPSRHEYPSLPLLALLDVLQIGIRLGAAARGTDAARPWLRTHADALDRQPVAEWIRARSFTERGAALVAMFIELQTCADLTATSVLDLLQQVSTTGGLGPVATAEQDFCSAGAQSIPDHLAAQLADRVRLGDPVRRISWSEDAATVESGAGTWRARHVIVAVPLAVVDRISFEPALTPARLALQERITGGSVIKSVLVFERAHWRESGQSGLAASQSGPVTVFMDGGQPGAGKGVLLALTTGRHALALGAMSAEQRRDAVLAHARASLAGLGGAPLVHYVDCDWSREEWSGGGYAARLGLETWTRFGSAMTDPIGPIHWAGAESARVWRSYMEGAVESGERAADEILARR